MESNFIHVDEAVAMAMTLIPDANSMDKAIARHWAYMGLRDIGPGLHWFGECELTPSSNLSVKKPVDMYKALDIALYGRETDGTLKEYRYAYRGLGKRIHAGNVDQATGNYAPVNHAPVDLSEDAYCFHLGSNGSGVTTVKLKYLRLPIGSDGLPLIPEGQQLAIAFFIRWMWSVRQNVVSDRQLSRADYLEARRDARAKGKVPSGIEMEQVAKEWVSLLNAPQFKQF